MHLRKSLQLPLILKFILNLALIGIVIIVLTHTEFQLNAGDSNVFLFNETFNFNALNIFNVFF